MKKIIGFGLVVLLITSNIAPSVLASNAISSASVEKVIASTDYVNSNDKSEKSVDKIVVKTISLEEAIRHALNSSFSLIELEYNIELLELNKEDVQQKYDDVFYNLHSLKYQQNKLREQLEQEKVIDTKNSGKVVETSGGNSSLNLSGQINSLFTSLASLDSNLSLQNLVSETQEVTLPASTPNSTDIVDGDDDITLIDDIESVEELLELVDQYLKQKEELATPEKLIEINNQINSLEDTLETLKSSLDDLSLTISTTYNSGFQMQKSVEMSIATTFLKLLMSQEQIELMKNTLRIKRNQIVANEKKYEIGLISLDENEGAKRELTDLEEQITLAEKQLKVDKATFALVIGVSYEDDYNLITPELGEISLFKQETSTEDLINKSYNMINARTQLKIAQDNLLDVDDERKAEIEIELAKLNIESIKVEIDKSIKNLFANIEAQFNNVKVAKRDLVYAKEDFDKLKLHYDLGMISKLEYDSSSVLIDQAQLAYNNSKYQYYLLTKQAEMLESGVILSN
ncbi:TolC family protein [Ureibacillus sp. NPDC094379]